VAQGAMSARLNDEVKQKPVTLYFSLA